MGTNLIGRPISEHGDRNVLAGNCTDFHVAVLMVFCGERETGANGTLSTYNSIAAKKVG